MATPLLTTKLYIPPIRPRERVVPRPRLIERLNEGLRSGHKLTLVSAPAGYGKTTLLSEWIHAEGAHHDAPQQRAPLRVAWLSLDERDNDLARFLSYLVAALQTVADDVGQGLLAALQSAKPPPRELILTSLINEIVASGPERLALVLDDYHVIRSAANQAVGFLLEHLPPQLHLVIVTRRDPSLPLARLRARGQMTEIRASGLQFTAEEVALFLNRAMGLGLTSEEIALLESRTEGWIAGLQLAALALGGTSPPQSQASQGPADQGRAEFIRDFSGDDRYVIDYLVSEVLSRQSEEILRFLLQTAILERLCGPLCDAVRFGPTESPSRFEGEASSEGISGQRLLEYLDQANLFLVPLDNRREWYRYHHLFGDALLHRLRQAEPGQIPELHRRASAWYESEGYHDEAIRHALAAQDFQEAARLVEHNALQLLVHSELKTLIQWLDALPDDLIRSGPWLCVYSAWAGLFAGQVESAQLRLQDAQRLSRLAGQELLVHIAVIRSRIALASQDLSQALELAREALAYVPQRSPLHGHVAVIQGQAAFLRGDLAGASQALIEAVSIAQECEHLFMVVDATTRLGYVRTLQGRLRQALDTYQEALRLADVRGHKLPVAGNAHIHLALVLRERNELDAAAQHLAQGMELCALFGNLRSGYLALARLRQAGGDWDDARQVLQEAERQDPGPGVAFDLLELEHCRVWLALMSGEPAASAAAAGWVRESGSSPLALSAQAEAAEDELSFGREPEHILLARALIVLNRYPEASRLLGQLLQGAQAGGRVGRVIEILVLSALAFRALGEGTQAMACLERALSLAEPEGYVRLFVDEGQAMMKLLRQAAARDVAPAYARRLLAAFGTPARETPSPAPIDTLSERELQVLRLLITELSGPEIARELVIAPSTMRTHTQNIYRKLDVNNRRAAVKKAEELDLI